MSEKNNYLSICLMKNILLIFILLFYFSTGWGQTSSIFKQDIKQSHLHFLETVPITFVIRGNYTYSFQLVNNEKGMQGSLISKDGVRPEKGDELIFVNVHNDRKSFEFYANPDVVKKSGRPIYQNYFFIDNEDIQWLLTYKISNFYIKKTQLMQMRKFALPSSRGAKLKQVISAFNNRLDRSLINKPLVVQSDPDSHAQAATWFSPSKSKAKGNNLTINKNELDDSRLKNKEMILADIESDNQQAELVKDQLREEVAQARLNAELQKEKYAKEVKRARELSLKEIAKINAETASHIEEQKELSEKETEELAWEVYNAKIKSAEAIIRIKNRSDEKIIDHENELTSKISELDLNYKDAQDHYSKNVQDAKQKAIDEINRIRKKSQAKLDSIHAELLNNQSSIAGRRQDRLNEENKTIYAYKEMILDSLAKMQEGLSRIKQENSLSVARSNQDYKNKMILVQKEYALELAELKNKLEAQRSKIKVNAVQEIERYNEALRDAKKVRFEEISDLQIELDSVRTAHEYTIVAERHKLEKELQDIAAAVIAARTRSTEAVSLASKQSAYRISEIQNLVEERRVDLLKELEDDRKRINDKRSAIQEEYMTYQLDQNLKKDSVQLHYVNVYKDLKANFDESIFRTRSRNDSLIGVMEIEYQNLKRTYADSIQNIRLRAQEKIRDLDRDNLLFDSEVTDKELNKENYRISKEIVQLKASHEEKLLQEKETLAKEMVVLRRNHKAHISEIQDNIKKEVQYEFARLKDIRYSLREEMDIMNDQFRSFKKQQQDRLNDESERFKQIMAASRLDQLNELLRMDSSHNTIKADIIKKHAHEQNKMKTSLIGQISQMKDSLVNQHGHYNDMLDKLEFNFSAERDSLHKQELDLLREHKEKIKISEQNMLDEISKNDRVSANEVYQAKQNARDEIARIKSQTLKEIKEIQLQKKSYEEELIELDKMIQLKKMALKELEKEK